MLIHSIIENSRVNGPGERTVIWTQGCTLACPGCWNPETHAFKGREYSIQELCDKITNPLITFSGGEPIQQGYSLFKLLDKLRNKFSTALSVGIYTGYTEQELEFGNYYCRNFQWSKIVLWNMLRQRFDFAKFGRYNSQKPSSGKMTTSSNQKLVIYNRYTLDDFPEQTVEVSIGETDSTTTGFPILGEI